MTKGWPVLLKLMVVVLLKYCFFISRLSSSSLGQRKRVRIKVELSFRELFVKLLLLRLKLICRVIVLVIFDAKVNEFL